jgi:hypothetical protein
VNLFKELGAQHPHFNFKIDEKSE